MTYDRAAALTLARRTVHDTMGLNVNYVHTGMVLPVALRVRWHNKQMLNGDLVEGGWSEQIDGINKIIFDSTELDEKGVSLKRGGTVTFTDPLWAGTVLTLDSQEPDTGPIKRVWRTVA